MMKRMMILLLIMPLLLIVPVGVEAQDGEPVEEPPRYVTGAFPRSMAYDGDLVWVANWFDNTVSVLSEEDGTVIDVMEQEQGGPVGDRPVALQWDGSFMWLANQQDNDVRVINRFFQVESSFGAAQGVRSPVALLFDDTNMWIVNQGGGTAPGNVLKIEASTLTPLGRFSVGRFPTAITWDGTNIWVTNGLDNTITVLDIASGDEVATIQVNYLPISIVFDGIHAWVSHYDGSILVIRASDFKIDEDMVIDTMPGQPERPVQLLYAFEHVWVTNVHDDSFAALKAIDGTVVSFHPSVNEDAGGGPDGFPGSMTFTDDEIWVADWIYQTIKVYNPLEIWEPEPANEPTVITSTPGIWLPTPRPTPTLPPTATPVPCDSNWPFQLKVGGKGIKNSNWSDPWRLREEPGTLNIEILGTYPNGTTFEVVGGPVCIDGYAWWEVVIDDDGQQGWFIEVFTEESTGTTEYGLSPLDDED